ncbi:MAG: substrate-binding domain-containing protein [Eubacterium sp.]|nr:substrate-binding domain-containing protein [Eubacterium sp.]
MEKVKREQQKNKLKFSKIKSVVLAGILLCSLTSCAILQEQALKEEAQESFTYEQFSEKKENDRLDIYLITKGYNSAYWDSLRAGAKAGAQNLECDLYVAGTPNESHLEILAELMQDAIDADADAIIVSPADIPEIIAMTDEVKKAGIPLIFVDTVLNGKAFDVCYATDNMQAGRMAAKEMIKLLEKEGKTETDALYIGIDIGMAESQTILERLAGFQEYWNNFAPKTWKVIEDIKINNGNVELAEKQGYEFMDQQSQLAGLVGLNNGSTVGLAKAVVARERKDLILVGFDYSDEMKQLITEGEYRAASIVQRQYEMGYESVKAAVQLASGNQSTYRYVDTGVQQVDFDNVNSPYIQKILSEM